MKPDIYGDPNFDPHRNGRRGFWIGALGTALVLALLWVDRRDWLTLYSSDHSCSEACRSFSSPRRNFTRPRRPGVTHSAFSIFKPLTEASPDAEATLLDPVPPKA